MGALLPRYKKALIDDIISSISSNNAYYYAFAAGPITTTGAVPPITLDAYTTKFTSNWEILFGKLITNNDIMPVIKDIMWNEGTIYDVYDDRDPDLASKNYYVVTDSIVVAGNHDIYLCLDNANGSPSISLPDTPQYTTFKKSDGYMWRYITSISDAQYIKFSSGGFIPVYPNTTIVTGSMMYSGVDVVKVANSGNGYIAYTNGIIQANPLPNILQIEDNKSDIGNFYVNCGIYITTPQYSTAEMRTIIEYTVNAAGKWAILDNDANTNNIIPGVSRYDIAPRIIFETDSYYVDTPLQTRNPDGYPVIDQNSNTISHVVMIEPGRYVSRANVSILPGYSNRDFKNFRTANLYAVIPPPGGYGYDPATQLNVQGFSMAFEFANTETTDFNSIPTEVHYNKIGIMKNPYLLNSNNGMRTNVPLTNVSFTQVLSANMSPSITLNVGELVIGNTSNAIGVVAFANADVMFLTGDKNFVNNEQITSLSNNDATTFITINTRGDIYAKGVEPLYVQNLADVQRSNSQTEAYKLVIQV